MYDVLSDLNCYFLLNYARELRNEEEGEEGNNSIAIFFWIMPVYVPMEEYDKAVEIAIFFWIMPAAQPTAPAVPAACRIAIFFWIMRRQCAVLLRRCCSAEIAIFFWIMQHS